MVQIKAVMSGSALFLALNGLAIPAGSSDKSLVQRESVPNLKFAFKREEVEHKKVKVEHEKEKKVEHEKEKQQPKVKFNFKREEAENDEELQVTELEEVEHKEEKREFNGDFPFEHDHPKPKEPKKEPHPKFDF